MVLVSVSGFVLIFVLAKKLVSGLLVALAGAVVWWALYAAFVP